MKIKLNAADIQEADQFEAETADEVGKLTRKEHSGLAGAISEMLAKADGHRNGLVSLTMDGNTLVWVMAMAKLGYLRSVSVLWEKQNAG